MAIHFKTPGFWFKTGHDPDQMLQKGLILASGLYNLARLVSQSCTKEYHANVPVICVGGIVAGGSGKTPTAMALYNIIKQHYLFTKPAFLTRGYGGKEKGPLLVNPQIHDYKDVGDESLLLAQTGPTIVSANRPKGAKLIQGLGADCIIMDDGFQNPSLFKNIALLVINGSTGFGNQKLLPAGPLREPLQAGLKRATAIIIIGDDEANILPVLQMYVPETPVFRACIATSFKPDKSKSYIGFCGIANPEKFQATLKSSGANLHSFHTFSDHYPYKEKDIMNLLKLAREMNAELITTEKDLKRIPKHFYDDIQYLSIALSWDDESSFVNFLRRNLSTDK